jgi:hypothetical protein
VCRLLILYDYQAFLEKLIIMIDFSLLPCDKILAVVAVWV